MILLARLLRQRLGVLCYSNSDLWVQASLDQRQRLQQLFFPEGIAFDGNRFVRTAAPAPAFSYLREIRNGK